MVIMSDIGVYCIFYLIRKGGGEIRNFRGKIQFGGFLVDILPLLKGMMG